MRCRKSGRLFADPQSVSHHPHARRHDRGTGRLFSSITWPIGPVVVVLRPPMKTPPGLLSPVYTNPLSM